MALELTLQRVFNFPRMFSARKNEPEKDYHWVGRKREIEQSIIPPNKPDKKSPEEKNAQKYRPLTDITLGNVDDVYKRFEAQLVPAQPDHIGVNTFCQIPLIRKQGQPSMIFGRVKICAPSDGVIDNVEELELYFPSTNTKPDVIHLDIDEINRQYPVQSYFTRVIFLLSDEETAELDEAAPLLSMNGFVPETEVSYLDLLEMTEQNRASHPWLYVVGSRWFDEVPESLHEEVKGKLKEMVGWGKQIFNYHPEWLPNEIATLNRWLGYKHGFTPITLTEPGNPQETSFIIQKTFDELLKIPVQEGIE